MLSVTNSRRRGSTLVFALMVIIAVLAIGVVFISRAGRDETTPPPSVDAPAPSATDDLSSAAVPGQPDIQTTAGEVQPTPVNFPPPPPPPIAATPDPKTLPPEG